MSGCSFQAYRAPASVQMFTHRNYQMRIPYEELTALANCLVNDTVFEIVRRLTEIQHVNEGHLLEMREQVVQEHQSRESLGWL